MKPPLRGNVVEDDCAMLESNIIAVLLTPLLVEDAPARSAVKCGWMTWQGSYGAASRRSDSTSCVELETEAKEPKKRWLSVSEQISWSDLLRQRTDW